MRILHVDLERGWRGGQQQALSLCRGLHARGYDQLVLTRGGSVLDRRLRDAGVATHPLTRWNCRNFFSLFALRNVWRQYRPDLVHTHSGRSHGIATWALCGRVPLLHTRRVDFPIRNNVFSRWKYRARGQHYVAISQAVRQVLIDGGVAPVDITLVPSGVDPNRFAGATPGDWRRRWGIREGEVVVGCVAAYVDHKDPLNLVAAAALCPPNARVVLVGDGPLRPAIEEQVRTRNLGDRVVLAGWQDDVGGCFASLDIFVMPSSLEGLCTSLLDAQAMGLPCIATRTGGIPDIIQDGDNGLLVPPRDPAALAEAIRRLAGDPSLRERLARRGPEVVAGRFTMDRMVEGNEGVYRALLSSSGRRAKSGDAHAR